MTNRSPLPLSPLYRQHRLELIGLSLLISLVGSVAGLLQSPYLAPLVRTPGFLDSVLHPIERNRHLRAERRPSLLAVAFTDDGRTGLAAGENGTILKSTDGGVSWTMRDSDTSVALHALDISPDGQMAWTVGDAGTILLSQDGGDTWIRSPSVNTSVTLRSVAFESDQRTGWATGADGIVLRSLDGGFSWMMTIIPGLEELRSVAIALPQQRVWAVGTNGTIVRTQGDGWIEQDHGSLPHLNSVALAADGRTGWTVGAQGILRRLEGDNWTAAPGIAFNSLLSVAAGAAGHNVVAVGTDGIIAPSADAGQTWLRARLNTGHTLASVAASAEGQNFWSVGASGTIIYSTDGGVTWYACEYAMYPAVWAWLLVLGSAITSFILFLGPRSNLDTTDPIAAFAFSDQPIATEKQDSLERRNLPLALSRLLKNPGTMPPLTVAITGEWGQGKTSLMRLLVSYMQGHSRVVWFNAWHHRREQHLFAALLEAVREQAVPKGLRWEGVRFRMGLLESRVRRHPLWAALVLASLGASGLLVTLNATTALVVGGVSMLVVANAVRSWVPSAGRLLAMGRRALAVRTFGAQLAFRHRFAKSLREVAEAFAPVRLLIVIDDLDRCQPEQVVETLEAVSFLVDAVKCYVVLGFARPQVLGCVGLDSGDIASELAVARTLENGDVHDMEERRRRARLEYAERYLEKLINVELRVPKLQDQKAIDLVRKPAVVADPGATTDFRRRVVGTVVGVIAAVAALATIGGLAMPTMAVDGGSGSSVWFSVVGVAALAQSVMFAVVAVQGWAAGELGKVKDSDDFRRALGIWQGVVRARVDSPRQLKRFVNRVRFLVKLETPKEKKAPSEELVVALGALQNVAGEQGRAGTEGVDFPAGLAEILSEDGKTDDSGTVAAWVMRHLSGGSVEDGEREDAVVSEYVVRLIVDAICEHRSVFSGPVDDGMVAAFRDLARVVEFR